MFQLFTSNTHISYAQLKYKYFDFLKRTYSIEINKVVQYFRNENFIIENNHILNRVLQQILPPLNNNMSSFLDSLYDTSTSICRNLQLSTDVSVGNYSHNEFFTGGSIELIIVANEPFNMFDSDNWESMVPVKFILHPNNNLDLYPPFGNETSIGDKLSIIQVDPIKLAVMYRYYYLHNIGISNNFLNTKQFIAKYVIPNMLYSQADISLFNRYVSVFNEIPIKDNTNRLPFPILKYQDQVDSVISKLLEFFNQKRLQYEHVLFSIPCISSDNMLELLTLPDVVHNRYTKWWIYLSRLNYIEELISFGGINGIVSNRDELSELRIELKKALSSSLFTGVLPPNIYTTTLSTITRLMEF